jgi:hypothetical protein
MPTLFAASAPIGRHPRHPLRVRLGVLDASQRLIHEHGVVLCCDIDRIVRRYPDVFGEDVMVGLQMCSGHERLDMVEWQRHVLCHDLEKTQALDAFRQLHGVDYVQAWIYVRPVSKAPLDAAADDEDLDTLDKARRTRRACRPTRPNGY